MKKISSLFAALLIACSASAQTDKHDVNADGEVSIADVMELVDKVLNGGAQEGPTAYLTCPDDQHPHLIDLGLPSGTCWSCCNMGAAAPGEQGDYFSWGDTQARSYFDSASYPHYDGGNYTDLGAISGTEHDAAHVAWGGDWQMPTQAQAQELLEHCTSSWDGSNYVECAQFTGPNGGTIVLPATGYRFFTFLVDDYEGSYWTSTPGTTASRAFRLAVAEDGASAESQLNRYSGNAIRPVAPTPHSVYDVNGDGEVGVTDVMLIVNAIMSGGE